MIFKTKTMTDRTDARFAAVIAAAIAALALSGCSSIGSMFGGSSSSSSGSSDLLPGAATTSQASATPATPADFDCPSVEIRSGASTLTITESGGRAAAEGTPLALRYQGSIVRTARECSLSAGNVNLRVGIEGRIVLGPAGGPGEVHVPLRIAVVEEGPNPKTVVTKLYRTVVAIPPDQGNSNFSYVAEDLSFPMPRGGAIDKYVIYLGFDPQAEPARPARPARRGR